MTFYKVIKLLGDSNPSYHLETTSARYNEVFLEKIVLAKTQTDNSI